MAALRGTMTGNRGPVSRLGSPQSGMSAQLETWDGAIRVTFEADGGFGVYIGTKHVPNILIASGNVNDGERAAYGVDGSATVELYEDIVHPINRGV